MNPQFRQLPPAIIGATMMTLLADTLELLPSSPNPPSPSWGRASVTTHDAGQPHYFRRLPIIVTCAASGVHSEA